MSPEKTLTKAPARPNELPGSLKQEPSLLNTMLSALGVLKHSAKNWSQRTSAPAAQSSGASISDLTWPGLPLAAPRSQKPPVRKLWAGLEPGPLSHIHLPTEGKSQVSWGRSEASSWAARAPAQKQETAASEPTLGTDKPQTCKGRASVNPSETLGHKSTCYRSQKSRKGSRKALFPYRKTRQPDGICPSKFLGRSGAAAVTAYCSPWPDPGKSALPTWRQKRKKKAGARRAGPSEDELW